MQRREEQLDENERDLMTSTRRRKALWTQQEPLLVMNPVPVRRVRVQFLTGATTLMSGCGLSRKSAADGYKGGWVKFQFWCSSTVTSEAIDFHYLFSDSIPCLFRKATVGKIQDTC